ncbi:peptidoglycan editing factor PgeF [Tahibacter sp.]|uniref:peptidoglycan editing factor PgeF n=1 Tax=Tahibacter sp. TaxID=2056211 RepID=UPI0028C4A139|nr:peptidoglycan editing factor PgeF [Tahibacter sp.]
MKRLAAGTAATASEPVFPEVPLAPGVTALVTTRRLAGASPSPFDDCNLGSRCGDAPDNVAANRAALHAVLDLPSEPVWLRQVHGTAVHVLDAPGDPARDHHDDPVADAAYTSRPGLVCAVQTADCLPLLIASADGREVAAVHAGWRGLAAGIIEATLAKFDASPVLLRVWLGPAIAANSYEVGDEVRAAFIEHDATAQYAFTATRPGHWLCDLYELARQRLNSAGVREVSGGGFDTFSDERFYSHRRARPTGRFASLIWIQPSGVHGRGPLLPDARIVASKLTFPRLLGRAFAHLPPTVRTLHLQPGQRRYSGAATIRRGRNWLARLCGFVTGMPPAMQDAPLFVDILASPDGEQWTRNFDGHRMRSRLWRKQGRLCERLGLVTFAFTLRVDGAALCWHVDKVSALGIPLPARWFRGVHARESEDGEGRYCFEVAAALPLAGELVHYSGWLDVPRGLTLPMTPRRDDEEEDDVDLDLDSVPANRADGRDAGTDTHGGGMHGFRRLFHRDGDADGNGDGGGDGGD